MQAAGWLEVFRANVLRPSRVAGEDVLALPLDVQRALGRSLAKFFLGEDGEGTIIGQARATRDPAFDRTTAECIALFVGEEWRHARELRTVLDALGQAPPPRTWSEVAFRRSRRLVGLRLKMITLAAAEVVGIVYYGVLAEHVAAPSVRALAAGIAAEEAIHLRFQHDFFRRVIARHPHVHPLVDGAGAAALFAAITAAGALVVAVEHGDLLDRLGERRLGFLRRCADVAWAGLSGSHRRRSQTTLASVDSTREHERIQALGREIG